MRTSLNILILVILLTINIIYSEEQIADYPALEGEEEKEDIIDFFALENSKLPCSYFETINITNGVKNPNGSITHNGVTYSRENYEFYKYEYLTNMTNTTVPEYIRGCVCKYKTCIRACCPEHHAFHQYPNGTGCQHDENVEAFHVNITHDNDKVVHHNVLRDDSFNLVVGTPCLGQGYFVEPEIYDTDKWLVLPNGNLHQNHEDVDVHYSLNSYCLAYVYDFKEDSKPIFRAFVCDPELGAAASPHHQIGMLISLPFLFTTLLVYAFIRELRASLHGKSLMCYVGCLFFGYSFLTITLYVSNSHVPQPWCTIFAYAIQISFMSSFFWLNVISFDIWWTFGKGGHDGKRFIKYTLYAYGSTLIVVGFAAIMDNVADVSEVLRPGLGTQTCWLQKQVLPEFLYLYLPVILIIAVNTVFFALSANKIRYVQRKSSKAWARGDSRKHAKVQSDKDKFTLFFRLFIIMGVTWSMEALSWFLETVLVLKWSKYFFVITDLCNCLQGLLIFLLFVWKPRVKKLIHKRINTIRGIEVQDSTYTTTSSLIPMKRSTLNRQSSETTEAK